MIRFAVGAIIIMENEFLLVKKQTVETLTGKQSIAYEIDFVKGGLETEECNEAALLRELYEETGSKDYQIIEQINQKLHFSFPDDIAKKIGYSHQQTTFFLVRYIAAAQKIYFNYTTQLFYQDMRVEDIFYELGTFYPNWNVELAMTLCEQFSLSIKARYHRLSTGQASVMRTICSLAVRTPVTLLDEPTTGMDETMRVLFHKVLLKEFLDSPRLFLMTTHHLEETEFILDHILLMKKGKIVRHDDLESIKENGLIVEGPREKVTEFSKGYVIDQLQESSIAEYSRLLVKNSFNYSDYRAAAEAGLTVRPMTVSEFCSYHTHDERGRIEDVFQ
ncbi:NUDIX domain-containing protein [Shouchella patagoniensis]|uniref:NUDIX domain-containing protein n=1 Tax=Shouchella patagoniensis TaxID=228576 RepID=UPI001475E378|nr:NUDIX domain-containing protein [Shouchella patagoniensis]